MKPALRKEIDLSPTDRVALFQSRLLKRRNRAIKGAALRLMATVLTSSPKRFLTLVNEARTMLHKEYKHQYELDHPKKGKRR